MIVAGGAAIVPARASMAPGRAPTVSDALTEGLTVPRHELAPQREWGAIIAAYLYLGGLGAGAFLLAVALDWSGRRPPAVAQSWAGAVVDWSAALWLWGPLAAAVGAALLIVHLGRNWKLFFTACVNPRSSWLARGFLILGGFIVLGITCLLLAFLAPGWCAAGPAPWRVLQALGVLLALSTVAYTGLLLRSMKYVPAWRTVLLPVLFTVSALSCGAMALALAVMLDARLAGVGGLAAAGNAAQGEALLHALSNVERVLIVLEALVLTAYVRTLRRARPEAALAAEMLLHGSWRCGFWGAVVGLGLAVPAVLEIAYGLAPGAPVLLAAGAASVLVGGLVLRLAVLSVGIKEEAPLARMSTWRRRPAQVEAARSGGPASTAPASREPDRERQTVRVEA